METLFLGLAKDALSLGDAAFKPTVIMFLGFLSWRVGRVETRIAAKLDNGLSTDLRDARELAIQSASKLDSLQESEKECKEHREAFEVSSLKERRNLSDRLIHIEEHIGV